VLGAVLALAAAIAAVPAAGSSDAGGTSTRFTTRRAGEVVVPVMVNGTGPFPFFLDTGSSHSAISDVLSQRIGAPTVARTIVSTAAGSEIRPVVSVGTVAIGHSSRTNVLASVVKRGALDAAGAIDGILGQDVLGGLRYTIDFRQQVIEWHADASPVEGADELCLSTAGGRFVVSLPQRGSSLLMIPDSGAQGLVLFDRRNGARLPLSLMPGSTELATLTGRRHAQRVALPALRVGSRTLHDVPAVLVPSADDTVDVDGLLPLHLLGRVTFDGPGRRLIVGGH
jgi:predicted aspartyl protease